MARKSTFAQTSPRTLQLATEHTLLCNPEVHQRHYKSLTLAPTEAFHTFTTCRSFPQKAFTHSLLLPWIFFPLKTI